MGKLEQFIRQHKRSLSSSIGPTGTSPAPYYDHAIQKIVELAEAIAEDKGSDMAAQEPLANTEPDKSAQGTIEDKLYNLLLNIYTTNDSTSNVIPKAITQIQAIITTETTKARIDEIKWMQKQMPKKVKGVNYGTPENNPHGWAYETYIEAWKPVLKSRLNALQKEQK